MFSMSKLNEDTLSEQPLLGWFKQLGYEYAYGPDIAPGGVAPEREDYRDVILKSRLTRSLIRINPSIPEEKIYEVVQLLMRFHHVDIELGNKEAYEWIIKGIEVHFRNKAGDTKNEYVKLIDFKNLFNNEFLVVNQFSVQGVEKTRRPDVVVFINGLPIAIYELKNPTDPNATIVDAFTQLHEKYKQDIPKIFYFNQVLVASDSFKAKHGTVSSSWDFFVPWDGIESEEENNEDKYQLEVLTKGIFNKDHLLDIIHYFIVFEADAEKDATKYTKKMCMYHQYFGVNRTIKQTLDSVKGNKKIGVYWHTQGSGKSLSMVFYTNKVRQLDELSGPMLLFLTDRNDLDQQLYKTFLRSGFIGSKIAVTVEDLKEKLSYPGSEILFTTIQKFDFDHKITDRANLIVIADEAHRSQYADYAGNIRTAAPNASFLGITGTPIAFSDRNTQLVFGKVVSRYTIDRSERDQTTVPIFYDSRLIPLHFANEFINEDFDDYFSEHPEEVKETLKKKFSELERLVGADDRLRRVAKDIIYHFVHRKLEGKAMVVTMTRKIAVDLYNIMKDLPLAPEMAIVISSNSDYKGKIQDELSNKELEKRFKNPDDKLKIVIVCDMWLTGFDVPHLHTIYIDKPIKGYTLMQAITRVNRRYKDKEAGIVVDYIGVALALKKAISEYTSEVHQQPMQPIELLIEKMMQRYNEVDKYFEGVEYREWRYIPELERAELYKQCIDQILTNKQTTVLDENKKKNFLTSVTALIRLFTLVMPHAQALEIKYDVEFFEKIKGTLVKHTSGNEVYIDSKRKSGFADLVSYGIIADGIVRVNGSKDSPNIMILDEKFLEEAKKSKLKNLTIEMIRKILEDEIKLKSKKNKIRYLSMLEKIEEAIDKYENNILSSTRVIEALVEVAKEIKKAEEMGKELGLTEDELSFYDTLAVEKKALKKEEIKAIVKELVKTVKTDLAIDWTDHEVIKARIRSNVRFILLRHNVEYNEVENLTEKLFAQVQNIYQGYQPVHYATY